MAELPKPPEPFDAAEWLLQPGTEFFRVHAKHRDPTQPNPGYGPPTRFAFITSGSTPVPVIYAAETARAAIAETVLHDAVRLPGVMNAIAPTSYLSSAISRLRVSRELRCADVTGLAAKRLGVDGTALSAHGDYSRTVLWAEAAFRAGFDGLAYMSHRCNTDRAFVLFDRSVAGGKGKRIPPLDSALELMSADPLDPVLVPCPGFDTLVDACTAAGFEVLV